MVEISAGAAPERENITAHAVAATMSSASQKAVSSRKKDVKYRKAPQAPKRFKSAFIFFSTAKHPEIRKRLGEKGTNEKTTNVAKLVSEEWKNLSATERDYWEEKARQDKARYEVEKTMYTGPWKVPAKKRYQKDPDAPKRPMSAFLSFSNSKRALIKAQHPEMNNTDVSRVLAKMWKEAPEEERKVHIEREAELRRAYKIAIADWRKQAEKDELAQREQREEMARNVIANQGVGAGQAMGDDGTGTDQGGHYHGYPPGGSGAQQDYYGQYDHGPHGGAVGPDMAHSAGPPPPPQQYGQAPGYGPPVMPQSGPPPPPGAPGAQQQWPHEGSAGSASASAQPRPYEAAQYGGPPPQAQQQGGQPPPSYDSSRPQMYSEYGNPPQSYGPQGGAYQYPASGPYGPQYSPDSYGYGPSSGAPPPPYYPYQEGQGSWQQGEQGQPPPPQQSGGPYSSYYGYYGQGGPPPAYGYGPGYDQPPPGGSFDGGNTESYPPPPQQQTSSGEMGPPPGDDRGYGEASYSQYQY